MPGENYQMPSLTDSESGRYKLFGGVYLIIGLVMISLNAAHLVIYKYSLYGLPIVAGVFNVFLGYVSFVAGFNKKSVVTKYVFWMNIGLLNLFCGSIGICAGHLGAYYNKWKYIPTALGILGGLIGASIVNVLLGVYVMVSSYSILKAKLHINQGPATSNNIQIPSAFNSNAPPPYDYTCDEPSGTIGIGNMAPPPPGYPGYQPSGYQPPVYSSNADFGISTKY